MKDRFFRLRRLLNGALAMLLIGGMTYSCSDDYDLPDKSPSWLGTSIYDYLKTKGCYTNTVRLIEDLDFVEVLGKTGAKTLFVADDDAYARFYANNPWGVSSYNDLTKSQKKMLFNGSMLDNQYLLEMLSSTTSNTMNADGKYLSKNQCMRRPTALTTTDTIAFYDYTSDAIPHTQNSGVNNLGGTPDPDYWARFRTAEKGGIRLACDNTVPLMMHWTSGHMGEMNIQPKDFKAIVGVDRDASDVYIFDSKIVEQDITCQNGYINRMSEVFTTPGNMAEVIRTNGKTNIYSRMLDRFSAPFYNSALTSDYKQLYPEVDSVFVKRYFNDYGSGHAQTTAPAEAGGNAFQHYLKYDPGWNSFNSPGRDVQTDMAAMLVPSDEALIKYFSKGGGGEFLMNAYATKKPVTPENLADNLDEVPLKVIRSLIRNLMLNSFVDYVPSKYITIMNDARDPMFSNVPNADAFIDKLDGCLVANNGVVYIMKEVYAPADYAAVSAPALVSDTLNIINWAITADQTFITSPDAAPLKMFADTYLKAMSTNFSLFLPSDKAMGTYYDPVSMFRSTPYVIEFSYRTTGSVAARAKKYDPLTGEIDSTYMSTSITAAMINDRLADMIDAHIIVDSTAEKLGVYDGAEYYITKGGAPLKVTNANDGVNGMYVQGGWQLDNDQKCYVTEIFDKSERTNGYGNGMAYIIDRPIQSTVKSVYKIITDNEDEDSPYREFNLLCAVDPAVLEEAGFADEYKSRADKDKALAKFNIFYSGEAGSGFAPADDQIVRFFSTYRYTIYIPTNEAVRHQIDDLNLPTWESIAQYIADQKEYIAEHEKESDFDVEAATAAYKQTAQTMITCLLNFVKYHFQDNSVFVDKIERKAEDLETACINTETNRYLTVKVKAEPGKLTITDRSQADVHVMTADNRYNMLARDLAFNNAGTRASEINTSSFAVLHQIDNVLRFMPNDEENGNRWDALWATPAKAKRFMATYPIRN